MKDETLLGPWVRRFLLEHLVAERNLARNTQVSYRDTLSLLLPFAGKHGGHAIDRMAVEHLTPLVVRSFLDHLELDRKCSGVTRNQRLATIRSLARFIGMRSPAHVAWCAEMRATPFKKTAKTGIGYLEKGGCGTWRGQDGCGLGAGSRSRPAVGAILRSNRHTAFAVAAAWADLSAEVSCRRTRG